MDAVSRAKMANGAIRKITAYAVELGFSDVVTEKIIRKTVDRISHLTQKSLVEYLPTGLANIVCEDDASVLILAKKLQLQGPVHGE